MRMTHRFVLCTLLVFAIVTSESALGGVDGEPHTPPFTYERSSQSPLGIELAQFSEELFTVYGNLLGLETVFMLFRVTPETIPQITEYALLHKEILKLAGTAWELNAYIHGESQDMLAAFLYEYALAHNILPEDAARSFLNDARHKLDEAQKIKNSIEASQKQTPR